MVAMEYEWLNEKHCMNGCNSFHPELKKKGGWKLFQVCSESKTEKKLLTEPMHTNLHTL